VIKVTAVPGLVKFVVGGGVENTSSPKAATPRLRKVGLGARSVPARLALRPARICKKARSDG